jgi:hypothetical protein
VSGARRRALSFVAVLCAAAGGAGAQQPGAGDPSAATPSAVLVEPDSISPIERPNGARVRPGTYVYDLALVRGGASTPLGIRTVQVTEAMSAGGADWLIAESRTGSAVPTSDSLWVSRTDLTPERWAATIDRTRLAVSFTRDSAFGGVQSYRGRSSFVTAVPPGALITGGMVERVVELLPLREGYRAGTSLLLFDLATPRALEAELIVERAERMRVGAADVECWVVALRAGVMEQRLWVSKDAPRVVRTEQTLPNGILSALLRP